MGFPAGTRPGGLGGDFTSRAYVDALIDGVKWKAPVRAATTAAGTLATSFENGDAIDGITLATGDRILIKNQASAIENGIYVVNNSGAPTRATDANGVGELDGAAVLVEEGATLADTAWVQTADNVTPGTHAQTWVQFGAGAASALEDTLFGSGSDGDVTIAAPTTLTRPMFYNNLTVDDVLTVAGNAIHVKGTLTINAAKSIRAIGTAGTTGSAGAGGVGGDPGSSVAGAANGHTISGSADPGGGPGGGSGRGGDAANGAGQAGFDQSVFAIFGGNGGAGGAGGTDGGAGGAGGAAGGTTFLLKNERLANVFRSETQGSVRGGAAGGEGGGGGANATEGGGGGGAAGSGGGCVVIFANTINNAGTINVNGGDGGTGGAAEGVAAGGGGGGGGGGGHVYLVYKTLTALGTVTKAGGALGGAGAGTPGGSFGNPGFPGTLVQVNVSTGVITAS
jgi:hypothetical protein